ncbi:uncharacterized protein LOC143419550 [Maylandia zebra]|uniref:uncharacterized protein LOC143419550 n=1 Tax=Maylandia zebra TaxID=106582 RepID=UPI00403D3656
MVTCKYFFQNKTHNYNKGKTQGNRVNDTNPENHKFHSGASTPVARYHTTHGPLLTCDVHTAFLWCLKVTPLQARRHEITLKNTKIASIQAQERGQWEAHCCAWPWFALMDEVIGQMPSTKPPVLMSSLPEDTPGPSTAVGDQNDSDDEATYDREEEEKMMSC